MQHHVLTSTAQCNIKCFPIQRLGGRDHVFRCASLGFVRSRRPAVLECRKIIRQINQFTRRTIRIQQPCLARIVGHPCQTSVVYLSFPDIDVELDQIAAAQFCFTQFPDLDEIRRAFRAQTLPRVQPDPIVFGPHDFRRFSGIADVFQVADKCNRRSWHIIPDIPDPAFGFVPASEHFNLPPRFRDTAGRFEPFAHSIRQTVLLVMCRRYQDRPVDEFSVFSEFHVTVCCLLQIVRFPLADKSVPVETVECLLEPSQRTFRNSAQVFLLLLTMDLRQGEFLNL